MSFGRNARRYGLLTGSISAFALPFLAGAPALAQSAPAVSDEGIVVTASRREVNLQDVPINVSAVGGAAIEDQGLSSLSDLATLVPGIYIPDQTAREGNPIIARGLTATSVSGSGSGDNDSGGTVATYVGEVPFYIDLRLSDMERVEFLLGPQGTLYGAGTLAGAIRYIPTRPQFGQEYFAIRGDLYGYSEGGELSSDVGFTFNIPVFDNFAIRGSVDKLMDEGFIDYTHLVRQIGVSDPDPDYTDPVDVANNLFTEQDANSEDILTTRLSLRWQPFQALDLNLSYWSQSMDIGGRTASHYRVPDPNGTPLTGQYEAAFRVLEPIERSNELLSLEASLDLGWGTLTSATGYTQYYETGQRDQTPLLITLEYGYELFPAFTAYTFDTDEEETFTQELRLVSEFEGPFNFILGAFFNRFENGGVSYEFTPGLGEYFFGPGNFNPRNIEFYSFGSDSQEETAIYGELSYDLTSRWNVTVGTRLYSYEFEAGETGAEAPLGDPTFNEALAVGSAPQTAEDDGFLYKFNTSYDFTDDLMAYFTYSEGYRLGGSNGISLCTPQQLIDAANGQQVLCALPDEFAYEPDTTTNYELGVRSEWLGGDLVINGAIYFIEWDGIQLESSTLLGGLPIVTNGGTAETYGLEVQGSWRVTDRLTLRGSYAYNKGELTSDVPDLIVAFADPATLPPSPFTLVPEDGLSGDRLPAYPEHQAAFFADYEVPLDNGWSLTWSYGVHGITDVATRTGLRGGGEEIDGYALHDAQVMLDAGDWSLTLYARNIFDEFYETGLNSTSRANQLSFDDGGNPVTNRRHFSAVGAPRVIGVRATKEFGG